MRIRKYKASDLEQCANLVKKTFNKFNCKECTKKGLKWYLEFYDYKNNKEKIKETFSKAKIFFVAEHNNKIIGLIRGKENRISNFFVNEKYHGRGLGRKLIERFEKQAKKLKSKKIKVKASIYAIPIYQKLCYKKTTGIRYMHGIKIQPMKKELI